MKKYVFIVAFIAVLSVFAIMGGCSKRKKLPQEADYGGYIGLSQYECVLYLGWPSYFGDHVDFQKMTWYIGRYDINDTLLGGYDIYVQFIFIYDVVCDIAICHID